MLASIAQTWKLAVTVALLGVIMLSLCVRPPRRRIEGRELRRLVLGGAALYAAGACASLAHLPGLAAAVYACGIVVCSLAVWLSRGIRRDDGGGGPGGGGGPSDDEQPPPGPEGMPTFDWDEFERELAAYSERVRS